MKVNNILHKGCSYFMCKPNDPSLNSSDIFTFSPSNEDYNYFIKLKYYGHKMLDSLLLIKYNIYKSELCSHNVYFLHTGTTIKQNVKQHLENTVFAK